MTNTKITELLQKVLRASKEKKINWEKNPKSETAFKTVLGTNTIHILKVDSTTNAFLIINETGDIIGEYKDMFSSELDELLELAKIKALRIEENLDDIDNILDTLL